MKKRKSGIKRPMEIKKKKGEKVKKGIGRKNLAEIKFFFLFLVVNAFLSSHIRMFVNN